MVTRLLSLRLHWALAAVAIVITGELCRSEPATQPDAKSDLTFLLDGVKEIASPGVPGPICVFGELALPVVAGHFGGARAPVCAATRFGNGRVFSFGHGGYFGSMDVADTGRLMLNAVRWVAGKTAADAPSPRVAVVQMNGLGEWLKSQGFQAESLDAAQWRESQEPFNVLCMDTFAFSAKDEKRIADFVESGGGLVTSGLAWGWLQLNPGKSLLSDHVGNQVLVRMGLAFADGYMGKTSEKGYDATSPPPEHCHAGRAFDALLAHERRESNLKPEELSQISTSVMMACQTLPEDEQVFRPRLQTELERKETLALPTAENPLTAKKHPLARLALAWQIEKSRRLTPTEIRAHPAAAQFPGETPADVRTVEQTVEIDTRVPAWHSTGLYAPPGKLIIVEVPEAAAGKGLQVRIGCHQDGLWGHDAWKRAPEITRSFAANQATTSAANAFGGLVYIDVPGNSQLGMVPVKISGAVQAPWFILGATDIEKWRKEIRLHPAPWAELACPSLILSVPSSAIRGMDDPAALMKTWDEVMSACADLAGIPKERPRPERFVLDVQIGAGYMHSGYPIMAHLDAVYSVEHKKLLEGLWGNFHEIGHNHQNGDWTFGGTGEVTCNLFTLYVYDKVCGVPPKDHPRVGPSHGGAALIKKFFTESPSFDRWKADPFIALMMYVQMQIEFGWEPFQKVFAEYRSLAPDQRPKSDDEKRDQWMARFSRNVGRNLGPFFDAWCVPTSEQSRKSIADLPGWMPEAFPPKVPN